MEQNNLPEIPEGNYTIIDRLKGLWPGNRNDDLDDEIEEALSIEFEKEATDQDEEFDVSLEKEMDADD